MTEPLGRCYSLGQLHPESPCCDGWVEDVPVKEPKTRVVKVLVDDMKVWEHLIFPSSQPFKLQFLWNSGNSCTVGPFLEN